jgi:hypothetical protein
MKTTLSLAIDEVTSNMRTLFFVLIGVSAALGVWSAVCFLRRRAALGVGGGGADCISADLYTRFTPNPGLLRYAPKSVSRSGNCVVGSLDEVRAIFLETITYHAVVALLAVVAGAARLTVARRGPTMAVETQHERVHV